MSKTQSFFYGLSGVCLVGSFIGMYILRWPYLYILSFLGFMLFALIGISFDPGPKKPTSSFDKFLSWIQGHERFRLHTELIHEKTDKNNVTYYVVDHKKIPMACLISSHANHMRNRCLYTFRWDAPHTPAKHYSRASAENALVFFELAGLAPENFWLRFSSDTEIKVIINAVLSADWFESSTARPDSLITEEEQS